MSHPNPGLATLRLLDQMLFDPVNMKSSKESLVLVLENYRLGGLAREARNSSKSARANGERCFWGPRKDTSASKPVMCLLHASMDVMSDSDSRSLETVSIAQLRTKLVLSPHEAQGRSLPRMSRHAQLHYQILAPFAASARRLRSKIGREAPFYRLGSCGLI